MDRDSLLLLAADVLLLGHVLFVAFVVAGLLLILALSLVRWVGGVS